MTHSRMERLDCTFDLLTPCFLGGADQNEPQRHPGGAFKGALAFWYRAVVPKATVPGQPLFEGCLLGSTAGQSKVLLKVWVENEKTYDAGTMERELRRFDEGQGRNTRNGVRYLGYPFFLGSHRKRKAWAPGTRIHCRMIMPRGLSDGQRQGLAAALWCLGHLGALGSRARRGFGSLQLVEWTSESAAWQALSDEFPLLHRSAGAAQWWQGLEKVESRLADDWDTDLFYPFLGGRSRYWIGPQGAPRSHWMSVLNDAGRRLQDFRLRREPDYSDVKALLKGQGRLSRAPERSVFGLPLTFRYSSVPRKSAQFLPDQENMGARWPSPLHLRLIAMGGRVHPLFLSLDGPRPGFAKPVPLVTRHNPRFRLDPPQQDLLEVFMDQLKGARPWKR